MISEKVILELRSEVRERKNSVEVEEKNTAGKKKSTEQGRFCARKKHGEHKHSCLRHTVNTG